MHSARRRDRFGLVALVLVALALGLSACGDDEDDGGGYGATGRDANTAASDTAPAETERTTTSESEAGDDGGGMTAPSAGGGEDQPGGAGDEVPASSQVLIGGNGGELHPTTVHVPPFIAIRVVLRSEDGVEYELEGDGGKVKAGGEIERASTTFEGLRAGERLVLSGPQGRVTVVADAEPGP